MSDHQRTIRRRWRVQTIYMILLFSLGNVAIQIFYILPKRLDHNDHTPYVMVQQQLLLDMIQPHHTFLNNKTTQQQQQQQPSPIDDLSRHLHLEPNSNVRLLLINHHNVSNTDTENRTTTTTSSTTQNTLPKVKYAYFTLISSPEYIIGAQILVCQLRSYSPDIPIFVLLDESLRISSGTYRRVSTYFTETLNTTVVVVPDLTIRVPQEPIRKSSDSSSSTGSSTQEQQRQSLLLQLPSSSSSLKDEVRSKTYTKLNVWQFINVEHVGVYFDADTIPIRDPVQLLYELDRARSDMNDHHHPERSFGVVGEEHYFNTGVFVFRPSRTTFDALLLRLQYHNYTKDVDNPTEQDLLISHFGNDQNKSIFINDMYNYRPLKHQTGWEPNSHMDETPCIIHYIGNPKPWSYILGKSTSIDGLFTTIQDSKRTSLPLWSIQLYQTRMEEFFSQCI